MASRHDIVQIDFQANAGKANAALNALRSEAARTKQAVESLQQQLANARATKAPLADIQKLEKDLRAARAEHKQWQTALNNNLKGVRALDEAIKSFNKGKGSVESMSAALSKTARNAAQLQKDRSKEGSKTWKEMDALIKALDANVLNANTALNTLTTSIKNGGNISKAVLTQAKSDLQQLIALENEGSNAWKKYNAQLKVVDDAINKLTVDQQQMAGKSVLAQFFRGDYITKSRSELEQMIAKLREYQAVIADPEGKGARHFQATQTAITKLSERLQALKVDANAVQQALKTAGLAGTANRFGTGLAAEQTKLQKAYNATSASLAKLQQERQMYTILQQNNITLTAREQEKLAKLDAQIDVTTQRQERLRTELMQTGEAQKLTTQQINDSISVLRQQQETVAVGSTEWKQYEAAINQLDQKFKIMKGEAMSLRDAMRLSTKAGGTGFKGTAQQLQLAEQAIQKAISTAQKGSAAWKKYQDALAKIRVEMQNTGITSERMQQILNKPSGAKNLNELAAAVKRAKAELDLMANTIGKNSKAYTEMAQKTKEAQIQLKSLQAQSHGTASSFEKAWSRLKTYVTLYVGAAVAIQKITSAFGDLMEMSDKLGEVRKTTGFTADEVGRLSDSLKKIDTRTSINGLLELSVAAGQLGLKTKEDVEGFTIAANKLMVALPEMGKEGATQMLKVALATGEIAKIQEQMNQGLIQGSSATAVAMEKVGSTIDRLRATSAATAPAITDFVKRVGAVGAQSGISIDQVAALGSTVDALGMRVEMSATALSRMIPAIKNNAFAIGQVIGKTEEYIKTQFAEGKGMNVILDIFDAIKKSGKTSADDVESMFGGSMKEIMKELNQQGARAGIVFAGLSQNVDELRRQLGIADKAYKENIAIQQEYDKMNETTLAKWERLENEVEKTFVGDAAQRWVGGLIDALRILVNFISGNVAPSLQWLSTAIKTVAVSWAAFKIGLGEGVFVKLAASIKSLGQSIILLSMYTKESIVLTWQLARAQDEQAKAAIRAQIAQKGLGKEMMANVWMAVIAAVGMLVLKLYDYIKATKEAAAEVGRFNQKIYEEQKALNALFEPLKKSNTAQEDRKNLIAQINSQYSKYLGYMLSETSTAIELANAHALIAKRIREEAYERRIAEKERAIQEEHAEDVNVAYTKLSDRLRKGASVNADVQGMADMLKGLVDSRMNEVKYAFSSTSLFGGNTRYSIDPKIKAAIDNGIERLVVDGKLSRDNVSEVQRAVYNYTVEAKSQHDDIMKQTTYLRSDLRGIQGAIQTDLTSNLRGLVSNIVNIAKQSNTPAPAPGAGQAPGASKPSPYLAPAWGQGNEGKDTGFGLFDLNGNPRQTQQQVTVPLPSQRPKIDEGNIEQVRQYVQYQNNLRGFIQANAKTADKQLQAEIEDAKTLLESEKELERLQKLIIKADSNNPSNPNRNPYGSASVMDSYDKWDANALVDRKKQMLQYVRALANGADVQSVLSQDKKFMDDATRKSIKDVRAAIEWYNTERLKIQEELADRHLTNEGQWANPSKAKGRKKRQVYSEGAVAELDRYYAWRKEEIERQRAEEGISEAEYNRRVEVMEQEHLERRSKLRWTFTHNATEADKKEVKQFWKWWKSVKELDQDIDRELIKAEWKVATAREKAYNNRDAQRDLTAMNAIVIKHIKAIENIVNKERPFNGITENLEKNLTDMGVLFADFDKKRMELLEKGEGTEEIDKLYGTDRAKRLMFVLEQSEEAFTLTWEEMNRRMVDAGMQAWADEIQANPKMQQAIMAEMRSTYDAIQNAIKKETTQIKKETDIWWNDLMPGQDTSRKGGFEKMLSSLGLQEDQVKRANQLIGAGASSERVADKLAIKQMQIRLQMQDTYYKKMRQIGEARIQQLKDAAKLERESGNLEEAKRKEMDAEHLARSLNLSLAEEQKKLDEQRVAIANQLEESENRLYTTLREWADLFSSGMQSVMEASHAGDAEYYNERAKMELTGKGGPGAGTYIIIDNEGTSDARAHYEYLDQEQALERQREIENENAQAEALEKMWDDINNKLSEQITDWVNASLQNASIDANTIATNANTTALKTLTERLSQGIDINNTPADGSNPEENIQTTGDEFASDKQVYYDTLSKGEQQTFDMALPTSSGDFATDKISYYNAVSEAARQAAQDEIDASNQVTTTITRNSQQQGKVTTQNDNKMAAGTQSMFAKMTAAANLYGIAYQAMSNENLSTSQKFQMIALQAAGQAAIAGLTASATASSAKVAAEEGAVASKTFMDLGPIAGPIALAALTAIIGGLMGMAVSKVGKAKSQIAQVTGASVGAGRLSTGMLTYAKGNVNEFSDPASLTPGRSYNVDAADGKTYRAKYTGANPSTHLTNGPEFHLAGEKGREMIIDAGTTRQITMNDNEIWKAIKTLSGGGRVQSSRRRRSGVRAFAEGNVDEFDNIDNGTLNIEDYGFDPVTMKDSLDKNNELLERALTDGIKGVFNVYGPDGLVASYDKGKKNASRHGEKY